VREQYYIAPDATELQEALGNLMSVYHEVIFWFEPKGRQPYGDSGKTVKFMLDRIRDMPPKIRAARQRLIRTGYPVPRHWLTVETRSGFFFDPKPEPYLHADFPRDRRLSGAELRSLSTSNRFQKRFSTAPYYEFTGLKVKALRRVIGEIRLAELRASAAVPLVNDDSSVRHKVEPAAAGVPRRLFGWTQILDAIGQPDEDKGKIRKLNESYDGPIQIPGQGGQAWVRKDKLLEWWDKLDDIIHDIDRRRAEQQAAGADTYRFGKGDVEVVPDISGAVKKRRKS